MTLRGSPPAGFRITALLFFVLFAGSTIRPAVAADCGGLNQRACTIVESPRACRSGVESRGKCVVLNCGGLNTRVCNITEYIHPCAPGLRASGGKCVGPPACGDLNQRACKVTERVPSCDKGLMESKGTCVSLPPRPADCGRLDQRPCRITERVPSCVAGLREVVSVNKCLQNCGPWPLPPCR